MMTSKCRGVVLARWAHILYCCSILMVLALSGRSARGQNSGALLKIKQPSFFEQPIRRVGESPESEREAVQLQLALAGSKDHSTGEQVSLLEAFAHDYPHSVWSPSLRVNLGRLYLDEGYYSKALDYWQAAWEQTKHIDSGPGKRLADYALVNLIRTLTGMGWVESVDVLLAESSGRAIERGPLQQKLFHSQELLRTIKKRPELTYRCGWMCLDKYSEAVRGVRLDRKRRESYYPKDNLLGVCSLGGLKKMAANEGMNLLAARRPSESADIPVPSIVHLKQGHYIALLKWHKDLIWAYDPLWGHRFFRASMVSAETSGHFLITPSQCVDGWRELTDAEAAIYVGRCGGNPGYFDVFLDQQLFDCANDSGCNECPPGLGGSGGGGGAGAGPTGCKSCGGLKGMPQWKVSEPNILLWLQDEPVSCQTAYGPPLPFRLHFKQYDYVGLEFPEVFGFGIGWNCPWLSCAYEKFNYGTWDSVIVAMPGGGKLEFNFASADTVTKSAHEYYSNCKLEVVFASDVLQRYVLTMPDGRQYVYTQPFPGNGKMFLTQSMDANGFSTYYSYSTDQDFSFLRLETVAGHDTQTLFTLSYTNIADCPNLVRRVTNRNGDYAELTYDNDSPLLIQIRDAVNMASHIAYNDLSWPETLITPYGTNWFNYDRTQLCEGYRRITVTEPNGGRQIFLFRGNCLLISDSNNSPMYDEALPSSLLPVTGLPAGSTLDYDLGQLNSFYWNQKQSEYVPDNLSLMTTNHYNKARMRHWLDATDDSTVGPDLALSYERAPSQDASGNSFGQITFYDYPGKPDPREKGTQIQPSLIARKLPGGSTWYEAFQRNSYGRSTSVTGTYGTGNPASTRTRHFVYAANGIDVVEERGSSYELLVSHTYNTRHQALTETRYATDSASYTTTNSYDTQGRLHTITTPGGMTTTHAYGTDGYLSQTSDQPVGRMESFTWLNGYLRTHTDARGLVTTYTRDALGRLTQVDYPDSTSVQYRHALAPWQGFNNSANSLNILDVTAVKDRMGCWTTNTYDRIRRLVGIQDARGNSTTYEYCGCGTPETVTDALGNETAYTFNNAGQKTDVVYADTTSAHHVYNALGQETSVADNLGTRYFYYNNQGLLMAIYGPNGYEKQIGYDIDDHPVSITDASGVTVTQTFDRMGRILTKTVPGLNTEQYVYSARGLITHTGADGQTTSYAYDEAGRKLAETTPKSEVLSYAYNAAGDLLTLTDGLSKVTTWTYDTEGRMKTKKYHGQTTASLQYDYDGNGRLTNRWTSAKGNTRYRYDGLGNLTHVVYDTSPSLSYQYDAVNRLTNMVDAFGTTKFTHTAAGNPLTEDGPLAYDTITCGYHASAPGLRTNLTLQLSSSANWTQSYGYDASRRLSTVTSPAGTFTYTYKGAGMLWTNLALPNTAAITNAYDSGARPTGTWLKTSGNTVLNKHLYQYSTGGRRTVQTRTDLSYVNYTYDSDGQLEGACGYTSGGTPIATEQKGYAYDASWNMSYRTNNGAVSAFGVNNFNQLTTIPGANCYYDGNGNLTSDGSRTFSYDDENQLTRIIWGSGSYRTDLVYDGKQRLRKRTEYYLSNGSWSWLSETRYLYDGMLLIQERNSGNTPLVAYTRGNDLSGSRKEAGGIGGLLARSHGYSGATGGWSTHHYYHADGSGNITAMIDSAQALSASYKYDTFGNLLSSSGGVAGANMHRFSSKMQLSSSVLLYYYGYRFYDASLQRWLNRDPLGERGGLNLYGFAGNAPLHHIDPFGLDWGDWYDPRTWFNSGFAESWNANANSIGSALGNALAGNWDGMADAYGDSSLGQTENASNPVKYGTRIALGTATASVSAACVSGVMLRRGCPAMDLAVGPSSPPFKFHVVYGSEGAWVHAKGRLMKMTVLTSPDLARYVAEECFVLREIPVRYYGPVVETGCKAYTCVSAAMSAFLRGWGL